MLLGNFWDEKFLKVSMLKKCLKRVWDGRIEKLSKDFFWVLRNVFLGGGSSSNSRMKSILLTVF